MYTNRGVYTVSFPLVPQVVNHLLRVLDRVMTLHDACTSGTSRVLTVASLEWLKMGTLIPAPADRVVRSMIKFLNAQKEHSADPNSSAVPGLWA